MGNWWTGRRWSDVEGRDLAKGILGSKEVRWKWAVWNGVGAQGEGAWQRDTEGGETQMGNWRTGGRWSDVEGGT